MFKQILLRSLDFIVVAALAFGSPDLKTFAIWMVSLMVALMFFGSFGIGKAEAEKIQGGSLISVSFRCVVNLLYVAALIYAGFPILAALYATAAFIVRAVSQNKLDEQVEP